MCTRLLSRFAIIYIFLVLLKIGYTFQQRQKFACPTRCQCYEDNEQNAQVHLICKWEQLNSTNLKLARPDLVRTLTIRCPYHSPKVSTPQAGLFHGFRNLDRLEIDRCHLQNVPDTMFAGLHQLYSLILKNGKIADLPREIFGYVPNLMTLDLSGNRLRIEPYSLRKLQNLIHLDLSDNDIGFLTNTLVSMTKLKVLTMNANKITNIDFRRFPENLTDLSIRHNLISTINYVRGSARNLKRLDMAGNRIEFIAGKGSGGSVNVVPDEVKHVDLSNNRINYLHDSAFGSLKNLMFLDLKNNSLKEIRYSSLRGSNFLLKLFLSDNPISCHCNHKWLLHSKTKNITIMDLQQIQCQDIVKPDRRILLTLAESRNQLLCKFSNMCEADCECCEKSECNCRFECPPSCKCLRSSDTSNQRTSQNIMVCENLRMDKIGMLPTPLTQLQLKNTDWKVFKAGNLTGLPALRTLSISNSKMTVEEMNQLSNLVHLTHLEVSSSAIDTIPKWVGKMPALTHLYVQSNPLFELNSATLDAFETLKKLKLGGNFSRFACDCETPSDFQRWLLKKSNRAKIEDLDEVFCDLKDIGMVSIIESLPGTNESVCVDPTEETKKWMEFVDTAQKNIIERSKMEKTTTEKVIENPKIEEDMEKSKKQEIIEELIELEKSTTIKKTDRPTTLKTTTFSTLTTQRFRKKFKDYNDGEPHKFVNILIFILFICVIILIISIGVTVYVKFLRPDEAFFKRKKKSLRNSRQGIGRSDQDQPLQSFS